VNISSRIATGGCESLLFEQYLKGTGEHEKFYIIGGEAVADTRKRIGVLLVNGFGTDFLGTKILYELALALHNNGMPICIVDFDEKFNGREMQMHSLAERQRFARLAMDRFCSELNLSSQDIYIVGHSIGGLTGIAVAQNFVNGGLPRVICINTLTSNSKSLKDLMPDTNVIMFGNPNPDFTKALIGDYKIVVPFGLNLVNFCHRGDPSIQRQAWQGFKLIEFGNPSEWTLAAMKEHTLSLNQLARLRFLAEQYFPWHNFDDDEEKKELLRAILLGIKADSN